MPTLKAHFDGHSIVLDEPATLVVGQAVRVVIEPPFEPDRDIDNMTDDELAEWLEVETHQLRGVPYDHGKSDGR